MIPKTMQLHCALTPDEIKQRSEQHLRTLDELDALEEEKNSWKYRNETTKSREATLREILKNGKEIRAVDVTEQFRSGVMATIRLDTYEVVTTRPATDKDRQAPLFEEQAPTKEEGPLLDDDDDEPSASDVVEIDKPEALLEHLPAEEKPRRRGRRVHVEIHPENAR